MGPVVQGGSPTEFYLVGTQGSEAGAGGLFYQTKKPEGQVVYGQPERTKDCVTGQQEASPAAGGIGHFLYMCS